MSQLLIQIDTPEDEALLLQILPKFNTHVVTHSSSETNTTEKSSFANMLKQLINSGVAGKFGDSSAWQQEMREDRLLFGRDG